MSPWPRSGDSLSRPALRSLKACGGAWAAAGGEAPHRERFYSPRVRCLLGLGCPAASSGAVSVRSPLARPLGWLVLLVRVWRARRRLGVGEAAAPPDLPPEREVAVGGRSHIARSPHRRRRPRPGPTNRRPGAPRRPTAQVPTRQRPPTLQCGGRTRQSASRARAHPPPTDGCDGCAPPESRRANRCGMTHPGG